MDGFYLVPLLAEQGVEVQALDVVATMVEAFDEGSIGEVGDAFDGV